MKGWRRSGASRKTTVLLITIILSRYFRGRHDEGRCVWGKWRLHCNYRLWLLNEQLPPSIVSSRPTPMIYLCAAILLNSLEHFHDRSRINLVHGSASSAFSNARHLVPLKSLLPQPRFGHMNDLIRRNSLFYSSFFLPALMAMVPAKHNGNNC